MRRIVGDLALWPVRGNPYTDGRANGSILLISTLTVEQSICAVYKFRSFQLTRLSLLFKAERVGILYRSILFSDVLYHAVVFVTCSCTK